MDQTNDNTITITAGQYTYDFSKDKLKANFAYFTILDDDKDATELDITTENIPNGINEAMMNLLLMNEGKIADITPANINDALLYIYASLKLFAKSSINDKISKHFAIKSHDDWILVFKNWNIVKPFFGKEMASQFLQRYLPIFNIDDLTTDVVKDILPLLTSFNDYVMVDQKFGPFESKTIPDPTVDELFDNILGSQPMYLKYPKYVAVLNELKSHIDNEHSYIADEKMLKFALNLNLKKDDYISKIINNIHESKYKQLLVYATNKAVGFSISRATDKLLYSLTPISEDVKLHVEREQMTMRGTFYPILVMDNIYMLPSRFHRPDTGFRKNRLTRTRTGR